MASYDASSRFFTLLGPDPVPSLLSPFPLPPLAQAQAKLSAAQAEARVASEASSGAAATAAGLRQRLAEAEEDRARLAGNLKEAVGKQAVSTERGVPIE